MKPLPKVVPTYVQNRPDDIEVTLACSIYEFYNGSLKTFEFSRNVLLPDGKTTMKENEKMTVEVKPGYDKDVVMTFPSKGHQANCAE